MNFTIPTTEEIASKYANYNPALDNEEALEAEKSNLMTHTKDELVLMILASKKEKRTDTVQDLARAILSDEEYIAATYDTIAEAIRIIKPEAKTSSKSIASYVSKKRDEWDLPQRIRITQTKPKEVKEEAPEATE